MEAAQNRSWFLVRGSLFPVLNQGMVFIFLGELGVGAKYILRDFAAL
ncbi:MAG: hypothetical protein PHD76_09140 [Methylacidiphilales bacterium]|nr:hypothetical protein [Candidatus Methylacidiphilales bacterium]